MHLVLTIYQYPIYKNSKIIYWVGQNWQISKNHSCVLTRKDIIWKEEKYNIITPEHNKNHIYLLIKKLTKNK